MNIANSPKNALANSIVNNKYMNKSLLNYFTKITIFILLLASVNFVNAQAPTFSIKTVTAYFSQDNLTLGDFDGDGKIDFASTSSSGNKISVNRNISTIGFFNNDFYSTYTGVNNPHYITCGDLDGDGKLDLVVANNNGLSLSIFRNISSGPGNIAFAAKVDITTGENPRNVVIVDLDGNGKPEIVNTNGGSSGNNISVFRNISTIGTISFAARVNFACQTQPWGLASGDLDGDGKNDLAVGGYTSDVMSIFRNTSSGIGNINFDTRADYSTGGSTQPLNLAIEDVDGDGKAEVVTPNYGAASVSLFPNTSTSGTISFATKIDLTVGSNPFEVTIADLNGDGKKEIMTANNGTNSISVLENTGSSGVFTFNPKVEYNTFGTVSQGIRHADFDGDGKEDIAITLTAAAIRVLYNTTSSVPVNPTITLGTNPKACLGSTSANLSYSATSTPNEYSIDFDAAAETAGFVDVALTALPVSPISIVVPGGAALGTYNATITVKNTTSGLSSAGDAFTVTVSGIPTGSAAVTSAITCNNLTDGSITVTPSGGSGSGYTYKEVGGSYQAGALFTGLVNGSHSFVVKDSYGCESTTSISESLSNPTIVSISSATKLSYNGSDLTCFGQSDGQITVVGTGGTGALEYSKDNGTNYQSGAVFSGLAPDPYTLIVKDANGCLSSSSIVTINQPTAISGTVSNNGPICANTTLSLGGSITGGTGSLTYSWTGPNAYSSAASATLARTVSANATTAMSGLYTVTVTDANNCTYNPTTNAIVNPIPTASISGTNSVCKDAPVPMVTFTGANGTAPYTFTYKINGGSDLTVSTASALDNSVDVAAPTNVSGTFTYSLVSVVDASSTLCVGSASGSAIITIRPKPILSSDAAPVLNTICEGTSTTITCTNATNSFGAPSYSALHSNNFNSAIGSEWTFPAVNPVNVPSLQTFNGQSVLGYMGNQQAIFNLTGLPTHDMVQVDFDLYIHDTWDGNSTSSGPDVWKMTLNGTNVINTTFSNLTFLSGDQAYPSNSPSSSPAYTGSIVHNLPTACNHGGGSPSSKYHITRTVAHSASSLNLVLEALGLEDLCNESWSIDNFNLQYRSQSSSSNIVWTNPAVTSSSITVSPVVNTYFVATLGTCSDSIEIIVNPTPRADFNINTTNQCVTGNNYDFTNQTTLAGGGAMTYAWTMTGANTTSATTTDITGNSYAEYGDYNVQLVATSVIGNCSDSRGRKTKTVGVSPAVIITSSLPNPVCVGTATRLTASQVLGSSNSLVYTSSYSNNFETSIGSAWTFPANVDNNTPTIQSYDGKNVMGYLTKQKAVYTQTGIGAHQFIKVEFDLYIHDSWDGNATDVISGSLIGQDIWKMDIDGNNQINTTFSNFPYRTQAYPGNIPAINTNATGSVTTSLPTACNHNSGATGTTLYHISKTIAHTGSSLVVELEALGLESLCNESWSIDNFEVSVGANTAVQNLLSACDVATGPSGPTVYTLNHSNDFNTSVGNAWTFPAVVPENIPTLKTFNGASILGYLGNQQAIYSQSGLTTHNSVQIEFDLYLHDTWDGNSISSGPDVWKMSVDGSDVVNTTFSNLTFLSSDQAFPNNVPASNPAYTSALSSTLPTACNHGGGSPSSKYHISKTIPHSTSSINIVLEAMGLENLCNESWSIDNFAISLGVTGGPASAATWNGGAVNGVTTCYVDVNPGTTTSYTTTIGACTSPSYQVTVAPIPAPAFSISNAACSKTVTFTNNNIEVGATYSWDFGDGSAAYVGNTAPAHLYANGDFTVTLTASFGVGCSNVATQSVSIADAPVAAISFVGGTGCGSTVQFNSVSTIPNGSTPTYLWSFGEIVPTTSTLQNPLKTYSIDGTYTVSLTVTTGLSCSNSTTVSVTANSAVVGNQAIFTANISGTCGNFVTTTNSSTGTGNIYLWNFGDGNTSNEFAPTHYYTSGGNQTITLSITNGIGCASSASQVLAISNNSGANARVGASIGITPSNSQVLLTNSFDFSPTFTVNGNPDIYTDGKPSWTFGDATGSDNTFIYQKHYNTAGNYTVKVVQQTGRTGCYGEATAIVTVTPNPLFQTQVVRDNENQMGVNLLNGSTSVNTIKIANTELSMYPNPNKGTFKVQINNLKEFAGDLLVVDMLGREIYKSTYSVKSNNDIIEVNGLNISPGTYHLVINAKGANIARKSFVIIGE